MCLPRFLSLRSRRGVLLLLTLWIVLVLTLMAHSLAFEMQIEMLLTKTYREQFQAEQIARIGVARGVTDLRNDRLLERAAVGEEIEIPEEEIPFDAFGDVWAEGSVLPRLFEVEGEDGDVAGQYELLVVDEESKLPLNVNNPAAGQALRYLLLQLDVDDDTAEVIANAVLDWQDEDDTPMRPDEQSERVYYTRMMQELGTRGTGRVRGSSWLRREGEAGREASGPFLPKNGPFDTVDELLRLPGVTPEIFYGYDPGEVAEPDFFPARALDPDRRDAIGLRDLVTARSGAVNVNTGSVPVLTAVIAAAMGGDGTRGDALDSAREMARAIVDHRQGNRREGIDNEDVFRRIPDLGQVDGFSPSILGNLQGVAPLTVRSNHFTIYCRAWPGEVRRRTRTSRTRGEVGRMPPSSHLVVACRRTVLPYPILLDEDEPAGLAGEVLPGYRAAYSGPVDRYQRGAERLDQEEQERLQANEAWYVPVVYFRSWNAF